MNNSGSFIDPKGLLNVRGPSDPKIQFYKTIKNLEQRLGDPNVILNSFILSVTPYGQISWWDGKMTPAQFESQNVFFKEQDGEHIGKILSKITGS